MVILIILLSISVLYLVLNKEKKEENKELEENYVQILEDGTKQNTSSKLLEPKEIDGLEITDLNLIESNNLTRLTGIITNKTEEKKGEYIINIIFVNKNGEELTNLETYVKGLEPGESTLLDTSTTFDYTNAYDIKITKP